MSSDSLLDEIEKIIHDKGNLTINRAKAKELLLSIIKDYNTPEKEEVSRFVQPALF